ncbi:MAG: peptide-methionine (S)-S-oxide reductase MsrA [Flavobacteriales bacterium]|nr:peptide-methionine (S)-S-oxide reductase MsrA [Flavobacteriales bacterium]MDG2246174.1 peptide-methionine (S)-S-oxide reductase MsrA [Flavobacteriales bacterium]
MDNRELITFGGGCFWCVEAVIQRLKGVETIESGYTGGNAPGKPTYREVCSGLTGHAEVIQVTFDPTVISLKQLLTVFMTSHDPTTLNRQGADVGTQYRSVVYFRNEEQQKITDEVIKEAQSFYDDPIVTEVSPLGEYYSAEDYHQNYYNNNSSAGYCSAVITPKVNKLRTKYASLLKDEI